MQLGKAANRHRRCAQTLADKKEQGEACYLIGLAAECAVKYHLQSINFRPKRQRKRGGVRRPDPYYLHFPELAAEVLAQAGGVLVGRLMARLEDSTTLQGWSVRMRYIDQASSPAVIRNYDRWRLQADEIFKETGL
jgi:hypothetical protein